MKNNCAFHPLSHRQTNEAPRSRESKARALPAARLFALLLAAALAAYLGACGSSRPNNKDEKSARATQATSDALYTVRGVIQLKDGVDPTGAMAFCAGTSYCAFADSSGRYAIASVPPGEYDLIVQKQGYQQLRVGAISLEPPAAGAAPAALVYSALPAELLPQEAPAGAKAAGAVAGQVLMADKSAPENIMVRVVGTALIARAGAGGEFSIAGIPPGSQKIIAAREGCESATAIVNVVSSAVTRLPAPLVLTLAPKTPKISLSIAGKIILLGVGGQALDRVENAAVRIVQNQRTAPVAVDGSFEFSGLETGAYTLVATAPGFVLNAPVAVKVNGEPQPVVLVLRESGAEKFEQGAVSGLIQLRGRDAVPAGTQVSVPGTAFSGATDRDGRFKLGGLPPGKINLICARAGFKTLETAAITIEPGQTADAGTLTLDADITPPKVLSTNPATGARGVAILPANIIQIVFSKRMKEDTVRQALSFQPACNFTLRRAAAAPRDDAADTYELTIANGSNVSSALRFNTNYRLTIAATAEDFENARLEAPVNLDFQTAGLRVIASDPAANAKDVPALLPLRLTLQFNGRVPARKIVRNSLSFTPSPPTLAYQLERNEDPATGWTVIAIQTQFAGGTSYTLRLDTGIAAEDGTRLDTDAAQITFETAPAQRGYTNAPAQQQTK